MNPSSDSPLRSYTWREGDSLPPQLITILKDGGVVVIPTDTLYALSARASSATALRRIYELKGRNINRPLSLFMADVEDLRRHFHLTTDAERLADAFLPGPLTLVLRPRVPFPPWLMGPTGGVGVRVPAHRLPRGLVRAIGEPLTATSANVSGGRDALVIEELPPSLTQGVEMIIDGGRVKGVASTVVDCTGKQIKVLREGAVGFSKLEEVLEGKGGV